MSDTSKGGSGGLGCLSVLQLIFLVLKWTGNIDWSWWCVLSPALLSLTMIVCAVLFALSIKLFCDRR
jgi:hypothetical protein